MAPSSGHKFTAPLILLRAQRTGPQGRPSHVDRMDRQKAQGKGEVHLLGEPRNEQALPWGGQAVLSCEAQEIRRLEGSGLTPSPWGSDLHLSVPPSKAKEGVCVCAGSA